MSVCGYRSVPLVTRRVVFDLTSVVNGKPDASLGRQIADCFSRTSCVIVRDPRVLSSDKDEFFNLMEQYFTQTTATKSLDARPELLSLGLEIESLVEKMKFGPHLLVPTGVDLALQWKLDTCIAGYHSDLNLLTIHGRARHPGLHNWIQNGQRIPVKLLEGWLLIQAGQQLERLTGGCIKAGMHEVVVSEDTQRALEKLGKCTSCVSSTSFGHVKSDEILEPMGNFKAEASQVIYPPPIKAGDFVSQGFCRELISTTMYTTNSVITV